MCLKDLALLITVIVLSRGSNAETLEVVETNTRLPYRLAFFTSSYDGDDSIYIWGGQRDWTNVNDILKYSISQQTIETVGTIPVPFRFGSGGRMQNGRFVQFGGINRVNFPNNVYSSDVWNFETMSPDNWTVVSKLPTPVGFSASVWDQGDNFYIIGGERGEYTYVNTISKYSSVSQTVEIAGQMPTPTDSTTAVWVNTSSLLYIFGGQIGRFEYSNEILKFNPADGQVSKSATMPNKIGFASSIWNGKQAYIIGGYTYWAHSCHHMSPIVRYNPATNEVLSVQATNFPSRLYAHSCVYVEHLSRIYIFGGILGLGGPWRDQIMYIDLENNSTPTDPTVEPPTTMEPPTTVEPPTTLDPTTPESKDSTMVTTPDTTESITVKPTTNPPVDFECPTEDGLYPDPKNCRGFYNCASWYPYHFCCPLPLFYNPAIKRCDFQDMVECSNDPGLPCDSPPGKLDI